MAMGLVLEERPDPAPVPEREAPPAKTRSSGTPLDEFPSFARPPEATYPTLVDLASEQVLMRRFYPPDLQSRGIGGTVRLLLWVGDDGAIDNVQLQRGSGIPALDRAALQAAPALRFHPATRAGEAVGTWVEFDLTFEPAAVERPLPEVPPVPDPSLDDELDWEIPKDWAGESVVPSPIRLEAQELLRTALGEREHALEQRFGPLEGLLAGDPPAGVSPMRWRADVASALERAMARDPDNPAPYLALARIRRKQGMRDDARLLFERGVARARSGARAVSPRLVAELAYEHGRVVKEGWLGWRWLGRLPVAALDGRSCPRRAGPSGDVDAEILVAWNYLCPEELSRALADGFQPLAGGAAERDAMLGSFHDAVEAYPGHVGANVEILLDLADQELWTELLNGARRFAWATQGHPYSLLLSGLALQRLGRSEESLDDLRRALALLGEDEADLFEDVGVLAAPSGAARAGPEFWLRLDPILATDVNERQVEHLARGAYAYLRFGGLDGDPARVWLRYGRPLSVRTFGSATGHRSEFWDYGEGPDVTFTRPSGTEDLLLTAEAEAYLDDLRRGFPHAYGTRARTPYSLPAQVARFRAADGRIELEVHLAVPEEFRLRAEAGDSLELGVFWLDGSGATLSETRTRVSAHAPAVHLTDRGGAAAVLVAVELYDETTHQSAGVRVPARIEGVSVPDVKVSDLFLLAPAAPTDRSPRRSDAWIQPLTRADRIDGERMGVFLELYDVPRVAAPHRLRVELVSASGKILPVESRPAGQARFAAVWDWSPTQGASRTSEYLTLDLSAVGPGEYTLRAVIELPGGTEIIRERAGMRRRLPEIRGEPESTAGLERIDQG
jgi:TonB family protein